MILQGIASSFPSASFSQGDCLNAMKSASFWPQLNPRSREVLTKVLEGTSGIEKRHFALERLEDAWTRDAQQLNEAYEQRAPELSAEAVVKALQKANVDVADVDALFVCSCTGFLCPGVSSHLAERLGLRDDVFLQDMTGFGCGASVPMWRAASGYISQNPDAVIVTVAVEVCSAAFYVEDDFGVLISTCLFGDGASAAVWSGRGSGLQVTDFRSLHLPQERERIRFTNAQGKLRNQLDRRVPELAGRAVDALYQKRVRQKPRHFVTHGGGRDVIDALESVLPVGELSLAREVMRDYGNLSSPSVMVALENLVQREPDADHLWVCGFGAGFSAHSCEMTRVG
ncbi:type III polyketide synthase [Sulfuriroseicoccus oceanibius]|uniref:Stilbene synthase n=1 Tax=Sulfuriroseicoccus oceanibius TaxID=2707525 RepID=A0A6B3LAH7_9BACT|nr:3-oxoacyl-[acyl-carrier-protein] synthase III C-terminal domain-containing protein [Sulfuriroseicoccus oceanibius]QQL45920.1 stilbene synthase [Sulfuriroseicoccus oceanibius]